MNVKLCQIYKIERNSYISFYFHMIYCDCRLGNYSAYGMRTGMKEKKGKLSSEKQFDKSEKGLTNH